MSIKYICLLFRAKLNKRRLIIRTFQKSPYFCFMVGIIVSKKNVLTLEEVLQIRDASKLTPIFISICDEDYLCARALSRISSSAHISFANFYDFYAFSKRLELCVSDTILGALYSFFSYTPCYLNINSQKNCEFISRLFPKNKRPVILPYSKHSLPCIKKVGAKHSDFNEILNGFVNFKRHRQQ